MNTWIALLRGVNVGGRNKLPMAEFRAVLTEAGFAEVQTYIQSGNVVLKADETLDAGQVSKTIQNLLADEFDIRTRVMVLTAADLKAAAFGNPFGQDFDSPNWMFLYFLGAVPSDPDLDAITEVMTANEKYELIGQVFYFFAGDGAARSKAMGRIDAKLAVPTTARNWRTVQKLIGMMEVTDTPQDET